MWVLHEKFKFLATKLKVMETVNMMRITCNDNNEIGFSTFYSIIHLVIFVIAYRSTPHVLSRMFILLNIDSRVLVSIKNQITAEGGWGYRVGEG